MAIDTKHADLQSLRIDRTSPGDTEPPLWAKRWIVIGIAVLVLLSLSTLAYRLFSSDPIELDCPDCGAPLSLEGSSKGRRAAMCEECGTILDIAVAGTRTAGARSGD